MPTPVITIQAVHKKFKLGGEEVHALQGASLTIERGELVSIIGPSGSGQVILDGVDISALNERQLTTIRNEKIGFVFQFFNLIPTLTALENVALPIQFANQRKFKPEARATELLTHLGLGDRLRHRPPQLSGGQQQRVAIARALANNPPLLLADEPTGNLNSETGALVLATLKQIRADFGTTIVIVTHDPNIAAQCDRALTLVDRLIV